MIGFSFFPDFRTLPFFPRILKTMSHMVLFNLSICVARSGVSNAEDGKGNPGLRLARSKAAMRKGKGKDTRTEIAGVATRMNGDIGDDVD